jgi:hypothetical protein
MYLTEVDHIQNFGLDGSFGVMRHSPRVIQEDPLTLDMDLPRPVSFPFFYDNSYWMDGAKVKLDLIQNLRLLKKTLLVDGIVLMYTSWFWFGVLVLAFSVSWKGFPGYFRARDLWLPIWTLAAFGMYSMIHVEYRYLAPFFVLFGLFLYQELAIRAEVMVARPVLRALSLVLLLLLPLPAAKWAFKEGGGNRHARMSRELTAMGLGPGDRLAVVGHDYDLYFVFLMGGRLTAKIMDVDSFWKLEPPGLRVLGDRLRSTGVKALLAYGIPPSPNGALWRDIEGSGPDGTHVLLLEDIRKNAP